MIYLKSDEEIDRMREAGLLAYDLLDKVEARIKPGISTQEINNFVEEYTKTKGGKSAPLNYKGFPKSVCTSLNHVVCHGIPSEKDILRDGDIINVDVTPIVNGYHGDSSRTFAVGKLSKEASDLIRVTKECLDIGITEVKEGARIGNIGAAIQSYAEDKGYSVVRDFVGHGIGVNFHEDPQIYHFGKRGRGHRLTTGMVFTIEPMINIGRHECEILEDGWTAVTVDGSLSAQFEHTIAIKNSGEVVILTQR